MARALITRPQVLFADEPTGALDSGSTEELLRLFGTVNGAGQPIVMVTHSVRAASCAGRVLFLRDGAVAQELPRGTDTETAFYRRLAAGLRDLRKATPVDAMIWHWWDWGYAAHHFSRRDTIADGAEHGGPSLYLPAAVYAADDPRFCAVPPL